MQKNSKNNFKAYFIDLDGTLLDARDATGKQTISKTNLEALERVRASGKHIIISTGRQGANAEPYLNLVKPDYAVLGNGSQIYAKGKIVKEFKLSIRHILLILEMAQKHRLIFKLNDGYDAYGVFSWKQRLVTKALNYVAKNNFSFEMHKEYNKVVLWGRSKSKLKKIAKEMKKTIAGVAIVSSTHGYTLEVTNDNATKGIGNEYIATKYLNIPKQSTAHIGDTMNDSTTIGHVGALIAMKNGDKDLKKLANFIGPACKNAGVAKILEGEFKFAKR